MNAIRLTDKFLKSLKPTGTRFEVPDTRGLSVRVSARGAIAFQFRYRFKGKACRMGLGTYPNISLAEARDRHHSARKELKLGRNPSAPVETVIVKEEAVSTIGTLVEEFLKRKVRKDLKRPEQAEALLRRNIIPLLGSRNICAVTTREIVQTLELIADRGAPVLANRTASLTKQMFSFAVQRGLRTDNPCSVITKTTIGGRETPRSRFLTYEEIWRIWTYLDGASKSYSMSTATKLLILTGQRRGELMLAEWSHFDWERRIWRIPSELSKNGSPHEVALSPLAMRLLKGLREQPWQTKFLFPSTRLGPHKPLDIRGLNVFVRALSKKLNIPDCSPHVLRHTFSTLVGGLGAPLHVIEKILNHSLGGMLAVYNHHEFLIERREVLETWGKRLEALMQASSIDEVKVLESQWEQPVRYPPISAAVREERHQLKSPTYPAFEYFNF